MEIRGVPAQHWGKKYEIEGQRNSFTLPMSTLLQGETLSDKTDLMASGFSHREKVRACE